MQSDINKTINSMNINKDTIIFIPCYNCEKYILPILKEIPPDLNNEIELLIVDNGSSDNTVPLIEQNLDKFPFKVHFIKNSGNVGYAGSQKIAFHNICQYPIVKRIIMLHGDGQYPGELLGLFKPYFNKGFDLINGYRSKKKYPQLDSTPWFTYLTIKLLSQFESLVTGIDCKEWHSGFVMYSTKFLKRLPIDHLTHTNHIDGEIIMIAGLLNAKFKSIPIYKRYKKYSPFGGTDRIKYIYHVFNLMMRFLRNHHRNILKNI